MAKEKKENKKWYDVVLDILLSIGIVLCVTLIVFKVSFIKVVVNGSSMNPKIENGDQGYMVKVGKNTKIERFDVVAGEYGINSNYYIIKRVLGLPNETVKLYDNELYVNGELVEQTFSFISKTGNFVETEWTLGDNEYLLVGDNRAGTIQPVVEKKSEIIAKNGFSYSTFDVTSPKCASSSDYASCPIRDRNWYWFKNGK